MINKISAYNFNNNFYTPAVNNTGNQNYMPDFCGIKLYNDRTFNNKISLYFKKIFIPALNKMKSFIINNIKKPEISNEEYIRNNRFIAKISKLTPNRYPYGEFDKGNNLFLIKKTKDNKTVIRWYQIDENTKQKNLYRSMIINKNNEIERYETSYPWKIFEKTDKGYICKKNDDAYIKELLKESENQILMTPTLI